MFFRYNLYSITWAIVIFITSSLPPSQLPKVQLFEGVDKVAHFVFYFVFSLTLAYGFLRQTQFFLLAKKWSYYSFFIATSYGLLIEILQKHVFVGREFDWLDALANSIGAIFGIFFSYYLKKLLYFKRSE